MVAVNFLWNPINDNIVREFDDAGSVVAEYTTEPDLYGNVVSQFRSGQTSYLHSDGQGNTTELTGDAGTVTDAIRYSAFGEVTQRTGTTESPFQYVGQKGYIHDKATGNNSVRQRSLVPETARWLSADIDHLETEFHAFVYVGNRPTHKVDPSGQLAIVVTVVKTSPSMTCKGKMGGAVEFKFTLDQGAPCDGYIIQHVEWVCVEQKCRCGCPPNIDPKNRKSIAYLETFGLIKKGNMRPIYLDKVTKLPTNLPFDDQAEFPVSAGTCGSFLQYGHLRFYCKSDIGNEISAVQNPALDPTSEWKFGRDISKDFGTTCAPGKMDLATFIRKDGKLPPWWGKAALIKATASRTFGIDWDCCVSPGSISVGANEGIIEP